MRVNQALILVGGQGTRLGALTQTVPKPLLAVREKPFINYLVNEIARHGIRHVVCLAGYRASEVEEWMRHDVKPAVDIKIVVERETLGTAGALIRAKALLDDEFLLFNGDSIFDINLLDLLAWKPQGEWAGVVALRLMENAGRYGVVEMRNDLICRFAERPANQCPGLINGGVYRLKRRILGSIGAIPTSIERDLFPKLAKEGLLRGRVYDAFFLDIGTPEDYKTAQILVPAMVQRPALFLDRDGVVNKEIGYAHKPEQIEWCEGIFEAIKAANDAGLYVFVVSNQAGIARGFYDEAAVHSLHSWMNDELRVRGAHIDDFAYCPHHPTAGETSYTRSCSCRKPAPGMIIELASRWPVDLCHSLLLGDKHIDVQTAKNAGLAGMLYGGGSVLLAIQEWLTIARSSRWKSGLQARAVVSEKTL